MPYLLKEIRPGVWGDEDYVDSMTTATSFVNTRQYQSW